MDSYQKDCNCICGEFLVLSCSGASDVGQLTDMVARKLRDNNQRSMKFLAMVATGDQKLIESFKTANILIIDGCPIDCGKRVMEKGGVNSFNYIRLSDWGFKKGQSPVTPEQVKKLYEKVVLHC